ncbi:MAG: sulfotransferase [Pseudomonadota bacterium]
MADPRLSQASALQQAGRFPEARALYEAVLRDDPDEPDALHLLGVVLARLGDPRAGVTLIERALALKPGQPAYSFNLGNALRALGRSEAALAAYLQAAEARPGFLKAHLARGNLLFELGRHEESEAAYGQALALAPDHPAALARLVLLLERSHRLEEAEAALERALAAAPAEPLVSLAAARVARRLGAHEQALERLTALEGNQLPPDLAAEAAFERGALLDRAGMPNRAFTAFAEANRLLAEGPRFGAELTAAYLDLIGRLTDLPAAPEPTAMDGPTPAFLIGFPRSGNTLLGQILDAHPGARTLDETPTVRALVAAAERLPGGYPDGLVGLTQDQRESLRAAYFHAADAVAGPRDGALLVDKQPLATVHVGLIHQVFPEAPIVFAQRHPLDVVLSCFMQALKAHYAPGGFVTLERTAALYGAVMTLWQRAAQRLPLALRVVRYEDLVEDFEGQVRGLLDHLGLAWDPAVAGFAEHARARGGGSATPSYSQVTKPLYDSARYRWRAYARELAPVMAELAPYVNSFGYSDAPTSDRLADI